MLNESLKSQLQSYLSKLTAEVNIYVALDDSRKSQELQQLVAQISAMSPLILVHASNDSNARIPSMNIRSLAGHDITFAGIPLGHEFTSLVLALLHCGGHPIKVADDDLKQIQQLAGEYHFESYISLSCQNCPDVVQALNLMAAINPKIHHTMIDGALFADEVANRNIMAVPTVHLNGQPFAQGRISLSDILNKIDSGSAQRKAKQLNNKPDFDVLIVGGGPAGSSAAIYAARKGLKTAIVADRFGGQVLETVGIENFVSVKATEGPKLVQNLEAHVSDYNVDIITGHQAVALARTDDEQRFRLTLDNGATLHSKTLMLSTGARWRTMNVPGEQQYRGAGVAYCPHCDGPLFKGKRVAVIGGGNSGIEAAIDLAGIVEHVTVLEFDSKLRADEVLQRKARSMANITVLTNGQTTEVLGDGSKVTGLRYTDRISNESEHITLDGIFVQIGLVPNSEWVKETLALNERGEIITKARGETSMPGVFAAGDVTDTPYKQIIIAMGDGANAALGAFDYLIRQGTPDSEAA